MGQSRRGRSQVASAARASLGRKEVDRLIAAARENRHGHRNAAMISVAYQHGLRVSKPRALLWDQVDFEEGRSGTRPGCQPPTIGLTSTD